MTHQPSLPEPPRTRSGDVTNVFSGNAEIVIQAGSITGGVNITVSAGDSPLQNAAKTLAKVLHSQWQEEAKARELGSDQAPMAVRWRPAPAYPTGPDPAPTGPDAPVFGLADLVDAFLDPGRSPRRLALVGPAGSGKTSLAVLLLLEILRRWQQPSRSAPPLPVLLSAATWDPDRERFRAWLARRIAEDYPGLPRIGGAHPAGELCSDPARPLLPVLDGLDEMPRARRQRVVRALNRDLGQDDPLIVTSRVSEYAEITDHEALRGAEVLRALPLTAAEVTAHMRGLAGHRHRSGWTGLAAWIEAAPGGPVAAALSNPLMLSLAAVVHSVRGASALELADAGRFPTRESVETHLLDRFVPAAFVDEPPSNDRPEPPLRWPARRAARHLRHLARHVRDRDGEDLAWWDLHRWWLPRAAALPVLAALGVLVVAAVRWAAPLVAGVPSPSAQAGTLSLAVDGALAFGALGALFAHMVTRLWFTEPAFSRPRLRASLARPGAALRSALAATTPARALCCVALVVAVTGALSGTWSAYRVPPGGPDPVVAAAAVPVLLTLALLLSVLFTAPSAAEHEANTPEGLMRDERRSLLFSVGAPAVLIGAACALPRGWGPFGASAAEQAAIGTAAWAGASAMLVLVSPWSRWFLAKVCLAATGRAPWSLLRFLRDARTQGVLHRVGGVYRFRGARLREHLSGPSPQAPDGGPRRNRNEPRARPAEDGGTALHFSRHRWRVGPFLYAVPPTVLWCLLTVLRSGWEAVPYFWAPALLFFSLASLTALCLYLALPDDVLVTVGPGGVACSHGRGHGFRLSWDRVEAVRVLRLRERGFDTDEYALVVRPVAGTPEEHHRGHDEDWYLFAVLGRRPGPSPDLDRALTRHAGGRWAPPEGTVASVAARTVPFPPPAAGTEHAGAGTGGAGDAPEGAPATEARVGHWFLAVTGAALILCGLLPFLVGRVLLPDAAPLPLWALPLLVLGAFPLYRPSLFPLTGPVAPFVLGLQAGILLVLWTALAVLLLSPGELTWRDHLGLWPLVLVLWGASVTVHRAPATALPPFRRARATGAVMTAAGLAATAAAGVSGGGGGFATHALALLCLVVGLCFTLSGTGPDGVPGPPPPSVPMHLTVVLGGAVYAVVVGGTVPCWIVAGLAVALNLLALLGTRAGSGAEPPPDPHRAGP